MTSVQLPFRTPACGRWSGFADDCDSDCNMSPIAAATASPVAMEIEFERQNESESESPCFSVRMRDPLLELMDDPQFEWGIIADVEAELGLDTIMYEGVHIDDEPVPTWDYMLHTGWDVVEVLPGYYSTRNLNDHEFERLMTWLYATGWDVSIQSRVLNIINCHHCSTDYAARKWSWTELDEATEAATSTSIATAPQDRYAVPKVACSKCGTHHWISKTPCPSATATATATTKALSKPGTDIGLRDGAPVPRFCNLGTKCPKSGCRYVHGDTIPRINATCRFDGNCRGEKRACCLHMHPSEGEKFVKGMVLKRM